MKQRLAGVPLRRLLLFGLVGGVVFLCGNGLLVLFVERFGIGEKVGAAFQLLVTIIASYYLSRHFVWHDRNPDKGTMTRFAISRFTTAALAWIAFSVLVSVHVHYLPANALGVFVSMTLNFIWTDQWVFSDQVFDKEGDRKELTLTWREAILVAAGLVVLYSLPWLFLPGLMMPLTLVSFAGIATIMAGFFALSVYYPHRDDCQFGNLRLPEPDGKSDVAIAVLIPARHEEVVLPTTILHAAWGQRRHSNHTILVVVNDDDPGTEHVARVAAMVANTYMHYVGEFSELQSFLKRELAASRGYNVEVPKGVVEVLVYPLGSQSPTKPKQLNYVFDLKKDEYDVFTILDAESIAAEDLLIYVDNAVRVNRGIDIFQGGIQLMPLKLPHGSDGYFARVKRDATKWYTWHNLLEYYRWFSGQMIFQSDIGFMPLGGNTVFIRTGLLKATNGWPDELTEDCALGVRAAALHGAKTLAFYMPELATQEEPPDSIKGFIKQRVRWNQGFLQTLIRGLWRVLPSTTRKLLALLVLTVSFFQAMMAVFVPLTLITMVAVKSPPFLVLLMFVPFLLVLLAMCLQVIHLHEFGEQYDIKIDLHMYVWLPLTNILYQVLLSYCALKAVVRHFRGDTTWQKTTHSGHHLKGVLPQFEGGAA